MSAAIIHVPSILRGVDTNLKTIISSTWARRLKDIWWNRIARTRSSSTKIEYVQWLLETAQIHDLGNGGRNVYGDMMGANWSIENEDKGNSLVLTINEIMDALGSTGSTGSKLEYAANWAKQIGNAGVVWPQEQTASLMKSATALCYDGHPFFYEAHEVNHVTGGGGTFANELHGVPFTPTNYADVCAYIATIVAPDGKPRKVKPRIVAGGEDLRLPFASVFGTESIVTTDPLNPNGTASASNLVKTLYETEPYIATADLSMTGNDRGTWWLGAELLEDDELSGIIYQEREAFTLRGLTMETDAELMRRRVFEWQFYGRNAISHGHPFLLFRMKPKVASGKTQWVPGS